MKRFFSLLMVIFMAVTVLYACAENVADENLPNDDVENSGEILENPNNSEEEGDPSEEPVETPEDIPEEDPIEEIPEVVIPSKVLKLTVSNSGKNAQKAVFIDVEPFEIPAGSTLEYDIYLEHDIKGLGAFEFRYDDRLLVSLDKNGSITDNVGTSVSADKMDLTDYAYGKWYRRIIKLSDSGGDTRGADTIRFNVSGLTSGCSYVCYYDNICIKDENGNIVKEFTEEELTVNEVIDQGNVLWSFEVVDDPDPLLPRKTAEETFAVETETFGKVSDSESISCSLDMNNNFESYGVYFGSENSEYLCGLNSYVVYNKDRALYLYHADEDITLASPVPVINTVENVTLRWEVKDSELTVTACDGTDDPVGSVLWIVPVETSADDEFGKVTVYGFSYAVVNTDVPFEDQEYISSLPVYDKSVMADVYVNCSTDKNPLEYDVGENMVFEISAYNGGEIISCPQMQWRVTGDDGQNNSGYAAVNAGVFKIIAESKIPGYVYVEADVEQLYNGSSVMLTGGAGADIESVTAAISKPDDFEEFWQGKLDEIFKIEPVVLESVKTENGDYDVHIVKIDAGKWGPVTGKVVIPKNAEPGSLKIKLQFMGYGVRDADWWADPSYITFCVNSLSIENGREEAYYTELLNTTYNNYGFSVEENMNRETVYFLSMLMRDVQAVRYMMTSEYWNGKDVEVQGGSQGGFQSIAVGALLRDHVTYINADIPWFCNLAGVTDGKLNGWFPQYTEGLSYYDSTYFAEMITCPISIYAGLGDYVCPPYGVTVLYNTLSAPKKITWVQNMAHGGARAYCLTYEYSAE